MKKANDVRNIYEAPESERELIFLILFPDGLSECTQCGHTARMHECKAYLSDTLVFCDCSVGPNVDPRIMGRECYNGELRELMIEELSEASPKYLEEGGASTSSDGAQPAMVVSAPSRIDGYVMCNRGEPHSLA